ncbi:DNA polymerase III subunit chi [Endozoicomonas sp. SCSIO W0465]|uniref:DNA polymerase III subunit chi n=1 Tax=Endozoicomonas sp. SCSIO W0465 TaxID=2918516 RepID=UPI00207534E6|nr:DNA polymerase III subunit chi [Endozoicomonas sp. SCSIO W0465]USE33837.1 DNA polymerase III subunit chi [Endozoicomonas sp. SCSIO W0465]
MTRVTFYLLDSNLHGNLDSNLDSNGQNAQLFACRLIDKAWRGGLPMHIHTADESHCRSMDQLLWSWREDSFLPHGIISETQGSTPENRQLATQSAITLGFGNPSLALKRLLINLSPDVPTFFKDFSRVCEVVVQNPNQKAVSRAKFRAYRQAGIEPEVHNMSAR